MANYAKTKYQPSQMSPEECQAVLASGEELHGVTRHWLEVKAGLKPQSEGIGQRGKDKPTAPRQVRKAVSVAQRYHDITGGRSIEQDMHTQQQMIQLMFEEAANMDEPEERFKALTACQKAQADFNKTWLPYLEQRLGTLQSTSTVEDQKDWDALLNAPALEVKDED